MAIGAVMPNDLPAYVTIGNRYIDILHDWNEAYHSYPDIKHNTDFIEKSRKAILNQGDFFEPLNINFNEQKNAILPLLYQQLMDYDNCLHKLAIVQGKAGTGKSCIMNEIVNGINSNFQCKATLLMAPTGVTANNIKGQTLHSALRILPSRNVLLQLNSDAKISFEEEFNDITFVIIDEASTLGLNLFFKIDQRLREAKPQLANLPLGGLRIYLVGDWHPVEESSMGF